MAEGDHFNGSHRRVVDRSGDLGRQPAHRLAHPVFSIVRMNDAQVKVEDAVRSVQVKEVHVLQAGQ